MWCAGERASARTVSLPSRASVLRGGQAAARMKSAQVSLSNFDSRHTDLDGAPT